MAAKEEKRGGATEEEKRKTEIVQAEVARMKQLPPTSAYATHRLRVLDKMQQLLSKARTQAETDELEVLFANMSFCSDGACVGIPLVPTKQAVDSGRSSSILLELEATKNAATLG